MRITAVAPTRVDFAGGPSDMPELRQREDGVILNAAIDLPVIARAEPTEARGFWLRSTAVPAHATGRSSHNLTAPQGLELAMAALRALPRLENWVLTIESKAPPGSGLGTSSALVAAIVLAARAAVGELPTGDSWLIAETCAIESSFFHQPEGGQDPTAVALGGLHLMRFPKSDDVQLQRLDPPAETVFELERRLLLLDSHVHRRSASQVAAVLRAADRGDKAVVGALQRLRSLAGELAQSLGKGDVDLFGLLLADVAREEERLGRSRIPPALEVQIGSITGRNPGVVTKMVGAGGGGCILVWHPPQMRQEILQRAHTAGASMLPFRLTKTGATVTAESSRT